MLSPEEIASKFHLEFLPRGEWHGPNPFESGATDDGFILFESGNAYDRKLDKSYSKAEVDRLSRGIHDVPERIIKKKASSRGSQPKKQRIDYTNWKETVYDYSVSGIPYARVLRLDPPEGLLKDDGTPHRKTFRQLKYRDGQWVSGAPEFPVLYNHAKVVWSANVIIVEGEKAADAINNRNHSYDWVATTNAGGTGNTKSWAKMANSLTGKNIIIIPDNDAPGIKHANAVKRYCESVSKSVGILQLDGLEEKGDVADWLEDHSIDDLFNLIERRF